MSEKHPPTSRSGSDDPLIDEVRSLRRSLCDAVANDVDRLCDRLAQIEHDYRNRTGAFASLPRRVEGELFPDVDSGAPDPLIDEVRDLRRGHSQRP